MSHQNMATLPLTRKRLLLLHLAFMIAGVLVGFLAVGLSRRCCGRIVNRWTALNCCSSDRACDKTHQPTCTSVIPPH